MRELDPATLVAYVDDELDSESRRAVELALARAPAAQETVQKMRESRAWLAGELCDLSSDPVPPRLTEAVEKAVPAGALVPTCLDEPVKFGALLQQPQTQAFWRRVTRIAAAIALLLTGAVAGFVGAESRPPQPGSSLQTAANQRILYTALESERSGDVVSWVDPKSGFEFLVVPIRTYYGAENGGYCREYRREVRGSAQDAVLYGAACRRGPNDWAVKYELIEGSHIRL